MRRARTQLMVAAAAGLTAMACGDSFRYQGLAGEGQRCSPVPLYSPGPTCGPGLFCGQHQWDEHFRTFSGVCMRRPGPPEPPKRIPEGTQCAGGRWVVGPYGTNVWDWGDSSCDIEHWCVCEAVGAADDRGELVKACACRAPGLGVSCGDPVDDAQHRYPRACPEGELCMEGNDGRFECMPQPDGAAPPLYVDAGTE